MVFVNGLRNGASKSCGHGRNITHGATCGAESKVYRVWSSMKERCNTPTHHAYARYGARGITVCPEWYDFVAFNRDMGPRPPGGTLERIDNNGNYCPENCRWATMKEQGRNRSNTQYVEYRGERVALSALAEEHGIDYGVVGNRVWRWGWDVHRALTTPVRNCASGVNRRDVKIHTFQHNGDTVTINELSQRTGVPYNLLYQRLVTARKSVDQALSKPSRSKRVQHQGTN